MDSVHSLLKTEEGVEVALFFENLKNFYKANALVGTYVCSKMKNFMNNFRHKTRISIYTEFTANQIISSKVNSIIEEALKESVFEKVFEHFCEVYHEDNFQKKSNYITDTNSCGTIGKNENYISKRACIELLGKFSSVSINYFNGLDMLKKILSYKLNLKEDQLQFSHIEYYDEEKGYWYNVTEWSDLKNDASLRVVNFNQQTVKKKICTISVPSVSIDEEEQSPPNLSLDDDHLEASLQERIYQAKCEYKRSGGIKQWVYDFQLPIFDNGLALKILKGDVCSKERQDACQALFEFVSPYDPSPTVKEVKLILKMLFMTFPKLAEIEDNYWITWHVWRDSFSSLFKNAVESSPVNKSFNKTNHTTNPKVNGLVSITPEIVSKPKPRQEKRFDLLVPKKRKISNDVTISPVDYATSISSNNISINSPTKKLELPKSNETNAVSKRENLEQGKIRESKDLMDNTFTQRRRQIVNEEWAIEDIFNAYPQLHFEKEIFSEFTRINPSIPDVVNVISDGLRKLAPTLYNVLKVQMKNKHFLEKEKEFRKTIDKKRHSVEYDLYFSVFALSCAMGEEIEYIFKPKGIFHEIAMQIEYEGPNIFTSRSYSVTLEGFNIQCSSFKNALSVYVASFYIFNLAYPSDFKKFMYFVECHLINLPDNFVKPPSLVEKLIAKVNEYTLNNK